MKRTAVLLFLPLLLLLPMALRAQDSLEERMRRVLELTRLLEETGAAPEITFEEDDRRVLRIHNVADLTILLTDFVHPNLELMPAGAEVSEDAPLFGKGYEGERFFTGVDELIDLVRENIRPDVWDDGRATIQESGPYGLLVLAEPILQGEVASYLTEIRRTVGRIVTVEVRILAAEPGSAFSFPATRNSVSLSREEGLLLLDRALRQKGLTLVRSVRITGFDGQRVALHRGAQRSFVQDYDVEVAQDASISDPIVGVLQTGLAIDVRAISRGDDLVVLDLQLQRNEQVGDLRLVSTQSGPIQAPKLRFADLRTTVTIPNGGFSLIGGGPGANGGAWGVLVSAVAERIVSGTKGGDR